MGKRTRASPRGTAISAAEGAASGGGAAEMTSADYYFSSYSHHGIHEEMLKDSVRTKSYMNAIMQNKHLLKDKVVLDVGCGTGILCMFAAKAGAKKVIGIDSSTIITEAREIVKLNGFEDVIELVHGKVEEVELPEGIDKVDVIVSEWMGYFLLYESMLDTVLFARDKWLVEGGLILPDKATLHVAAIEDAEYRGEKIDFWDSVYGFDMSPIKKLAMLEPLVDTVEPDTIISDTCLIFSIDVATVKKEDLAFKVPFSINFTRNDYCHALISYFDIEFTHIHKKITFSTSPRAKYTHWKQTVFYLDDVLTVSAGDTLSGVIDCKPNKKNHRDLDIEIDFKFTDDSGPVERHQSYRLR